MEATDGSEEALLHVATGRLDLALVQGGDPPRRGVSEVASLGVEPLHLLVRPRYLGGGLAGLRGARLSLSSPGSGTRRLARAALSFAGMEPGRDYTDVALRYEEIIRMRDADLPDGLFLVSSMPSPVADALIRRHGYRLMPLPYGAAMGLRDVGVLPATIPAYTYGVEPAVPPADLPTVGNRLLLVAHENAPPDAVRAVTAAVYGGDFARRANLPNPDETEPERSPELPLHPGAYAHFHRDDPVLTSDLLQGADSLRNLLVSLSLALFLLWRWGRRRRYAGFERYLAEVTEIEKRALALEASAIPDVGALMASRNRLSALKTEALERYAAGQLRGEELMTAFLSHVADVRNHLNALILNERERLAAQSADALPDAEQEARFRAGWRAAVRGAAEPVTDDAGDAPPTF